MRAPALPVVTLLLGLTLTACGDDAEKGATGAQKATVTAGDTTCELSKTSFAAGELALDVKNEGKDVTEVYVYAKGDSGKFDKVVGEVENIAPSTSRDFEVKVGGGEYEVACKPGQKGDGIRTEIQVSGEATTDEAYDREVEVEATDFAFEGLSGFTAKVGERIEFKLENKGHTAHDLVFFDADDKRIGGIDAVEAGKDGEVVVEFEKAGTYTYRCTIGRHAEEGMEGTFTVS
jgi:uncharacterized cupredoxin-like copper-binding protein